MNEKSTNGNFLNFSVTPPVSQVSPKVPENSANDGEPPEFTSRSLFDFSVFDHRKAKGSGAPKPTAPADATKGNIQLFNIVNTFKKSVGNAVDTATEVKDVLKNAMRTKTNTVVKKNFKFYLIKIAKLVFQLLYHVVLIIFNLATGNIIGVILHIGTILHLIWYTIANFNL